MAGNHFLDTAIGQGILTTPTKGVAMGEAGRIVEPNLGDFPRDTQACFFGLRYVYCIFSTWD